MSYLITSFPPAFSSYTGPGDIVSGASAWYGVYAYSGAYAASGGNALELRRASDNATQIFTFLTTGDLDTSAISTWAGGSNMFVKTAYDHTGNSRNAANVTNANQPQFFLTGGKGNKPYIKMESGKNLTGPSFTPASGVATFACVGLRNTGGIQQVWISQNGGTRNALCGSDAGTANTWMLIRGAATVQRLNATASDNNWHVATGVMNEASAVLVIDGGTPATGTVTGSTGVGAITFATTSTNSGGCQEGGFWDNLAFNSTQYAAVAANQLARYA